MPTEEERTHHYLWRIRNALPEGRPHRRCSTVRITRTSWWSGCTTWSPPDVWGARYDEINAFEKELVDGGMTIVKVAMFVSLEEQKQRLAARLDRPDKYWKYNPGDLDERALWPAYREAYQAVLDKTSTDYAPWHVVPCDKKWYSRLAVTELLIEALTSIELVLAAGRFRYRGREAEARRGLTRAGWDAAIWRG